MGRWLQIARGAGCELPGDEGWGRGHRPMVNGSRNASDAGQARLRRRALHWRSSGHWRSVA